MADQTRVHLTSSDTLTIAATPLGHILAEVSWSEKPIVRETMNAAHYPNPAIDIDGKEAELDIKATITSGSALPSTATIQALVVTATNFSFSGNVLITEVSGTYTPDKSAEISMKVKTTDQDYTLTKGS